jgi:nitrate/TMAO reductase-like tetraheme cytochrome c subunit
MKIPSQELAMSKLRTIRPVHILMIAAGLGLAAISLLLLVKPVEASPGTKLVEASQGAQLVDAPSTRPVLAPDNSACLACHSKSGISLTFPNGDQLPLTIDQGHFSDSVHGALACTDCHTDITGYPHPNFNQQTRRDVSLKWYTSCQKCHAEQYNQTLDSVHQRALAAGNTNAAICTDCHNPHTQTQMTDKTTGKLLPQARLLIPQTCARCHSTIYNTYIQSVHGAALTDLGNLDVPTCIDCHGVHNISDPTTSAFRVNSPQICAKCHTNSTLMSKYGISTAVLNTYVADFHGTTVTLFQKLSPDQATNKPVCFDCHGVHDIKRVDDPVYGLQMKQNLLLTCQRCHPDATINFPNAWLSHFIPSPNHSAIVYYVNIFYKFFIPTVIGGMAVFVISDIVRRLIERRRGVKHS